MHSIDTVKTRQQGDPNIPSKYTSLSSTYSKIFRQEGVRRGLYGGVTPAFLGSFPGTIIFFGVYEYSKRHMIDAGVNHSLAYLAGGMQFTACDELLANFDRLHCRPCCLCCLRPIRSPQNAPPAPRPIQQPFFQIRLQLSLDGRRYQNYSAPGRTLRSFLWLQSDDMARPTILGSPIRVLRARAEAGDEVGWR